MTNVTGLAFILLQKILPKHLLTAAVHRLARIRYVPVKNWLISRFVAAYRVDVEEASRRVPDGYASFNDFFTRDLRHDARSIDARPGTVVSPVDGTVSAAGRMDGESLLQAKGISYTLSDLIATDLTEAEELAGGLFATIYLAPYNYHRVHCPLEGQLVSARYVPGRLYSVNETTTSLLPGLFTGNERLVCRFQTPHGPVMLVFVGALNVGSISTPWTGEIRPRKHGVAESIDLEKSGHPRALGRGDLLGWFNMGSTVILLMPGSHCRWLDNVVPGSRLRMGQAIANLASRSS
jgi:phosphatidylserine decarboxylase